MNRILIGFFTLVFFSNTNAFFWDSTIIKVNCISGNNKIYYKYEYEFKDREIYETFIDPKEKILLSLEKLEDCVIKDIKNWVCGGKSTFGTSITGKSEYYVSERHAVLDGRYRYRTSSRNSIDEEDNYCKKRIQSN